MSVTPVKNKIVDGAKTLTLPASPLMKILGYGTGVTVYKLDRSPNRSPWVLKKVSRQAKDCKGMSLRIKFEANILRRLSHPNIVGFRALMNQNDGRQCMALEDCTISLGDLIENRVEKDIATPFPAAQIQKVACDVVEALKYLHTEALVLHGDLKSYNILIKDNFTICKICDFGVSMPLQSDGTLDTVKAGDEAEYVGTELWCAPEIISSPQVVTDKADIYSFGLCLWEMIALEPPNYEAGEEISLLDDDDKIDDVDSNLQIEELRQRPKVSCEYLDDSYLSVLQVYYSTTEVNYIQRPSATELCTLLHEIFK